MLCFRIMVGMGLSLGSSVALGHAKFADPNYAGADPALKGTVLPRVASDGLKDVNNPCGAPPTADDTKRTVLVAGSKFRVVFLETIDHISKYRIGFSVDETDNFNVELMNQDQFENKALHPQDIAGRLDVDGTVADRFNAPRAYEFEITVPNTPCEKCALQMVQRMFPARNPNQVGDYTTSDYFSCADIKIVNDPALVPPLAPTNLKIDIQKKEVGQ